ncbi:low affinity immunoglobulin gamma Fc region receptor II-b isoform X1 [Echinops telfairi]|uniref:low affinity immunoglobulin gamma Fc region receptor II-b isoform X1 n=1 Tax=Echinops telfairi TaxID=9371 RepID=UPI001E1DB1D2|nr:low affinity immunoglobulin gamma Fc region receptor II-b isoform X1 [Echinops telfairi]
MEIPSSLPISSGENDQAACTSSRPLGQILLWTALLFLGCIKTSFLLLVPVAGTSGSTPDLPKAVMNLEPPWVNVLRDDYVTLKCHGAHTPGNDSTQWFHRGRLIPSQVQPSYSFKATVNDNGEYRCQTDQSSLSDPVQLDVQMDWLLLQTLHWVFQEGDSIVLRCHTFRNKTLYKITFFHNGISKKYSPNNPNFSIPRANASHSGDYYCTGFLKEKHTSKSVTITVQRTKTESSSSLGVMVAAVVSGIVVLIIIATGVTLFCLRRKQTSANFPDTEEAAKMETEKAVTYSLLEHTECPEEEIGSLDYQNSA